jgi:hypothetical protein
VLQSVETGLWCRLAPLASNTTQMGMVCDQPTATTGTVLTYTGDGLSYNGIDLVASGPGQPLLLENTTRVPVAGPTSDNLALVPAPVGERGSCQGRCSAAQCSTVPCGAVRLRAAQGSPAGLNSVIAPFCSSFFHMHATVPHQHACVPHAASAPAPLTPLSHPPQAPLSLWTPR